MNITPLDSFETALLTELRTHVADRPERRPRHHRRWAVGLAAAAAAGAGLVVAGTGGGTVVGPTPAFAVEQAADGEIVVEINRLQDSAGLEDALREHGIDADVRFDRRSADGEFDVRLPDVAGGPVQLFPPDSSGDPDSRACPPTLLGAETATFTPEDDRWVLRIPEDSILLERAVRITTQRDGDLTVLFESNTPGRFCGVVG